MEAFDLAFESAIRMLLDQGMSELEVAKTLLPACKNKKDSWDTYTVLKEVLRVNDPSLSYGERCREALRLRGTS